MAIWHKLMLYISGLILLLYQSFDTISIIICLVALIFACFITYLSDHSIFLIVMTLIYLALCFWNGLFCCFIPLMLYEIFRSRLWFIAALSAFVFLLILQENIFILLLLAVQSVLCFFLQYQITLNEKLSENFKITRDSNEELTLALRSKNRYLMEKQDYEINLATLQERNRIAREIHDNVGHMLTRSILQTGAVMAVNDNPKLDSQLIELKDSLNDAMNTIRKSVHGLRDESIDLHRSIEDLLHGLSDYHVQLDYDMSDKIPADIKYCFLTVLKEAISNTAKHSDATSIIIKAREYPQSYHLYIKDNGINSKIKSIGGMGLSNMRERVEALNGTFTVNNNSGFHIFISINKQELEKE